MYDGIQHDRQKGDGQGKAGHHMVGIVPFKDKGPVACGKTFVVFPLKFGDHIVHPPVQLHTAGIQAVHLCQQPGPPFSLFPGDPFIQGAEHACCRPG